MTAEFIKHRWQARRTLTDQPPPDLRFGELAFADAIDRLFVGKSNGNSAEFFSLAEAGKTLGVIKAIEASDSAYTVFQTSRFSIGSAVTHTVFNIIQSCEVVWGYVIGPLGQPSMILDGALFDPMDVFGDDTAGNTFTAFPVFPAKAKTSLAFRVTNQSAITRDYSWVIYVRIL